MASFFYKNGLKLDYLFFQLIDKAYFDCSGKDYRNEILKELQKKYKNIKSLNASYKTDYKYFEEIFIPKKPCENTLLKENVLENPFLAIDYFDYFSMWEEYDFKNNKQKSNILFLEDLKFYNFLRSRNQFYPLSIDLLQVLGIGRNNFFSETSETIKEILLMQDMFLDSLNSLDISFHYKSSDILYTELLDYKMVVLSSDLFIDDNLEKILIDYCYNGGILLLLGQSGKLKKYFNNKIMDLDTNNKLYNIKLFLFEKGNAILFSFNNNVNDILHEKGEDFLKQVEKISGIKFEKNNRTSGVFRAGILRDKLLKGLENRLNTSFKFVSFYDEKILIKELCCNNAGKDKIIVKLDKLRSEMISLFDNHLNEREEEGFMENVSSLDYILDHFVSQNIFSIKRR